MDNHQGEMISGSIDRLSEVIERGQPEGGFSPAECVRFHKPDVCLVVEGKYSEVFDAEHCLNNLGNGIHVPSPDVLHRFKQIMVRVVGPQLIELKLYSPDNTELVTFSGPFTIFWS